jgi:glutathione S-transferase
MGLLSGPLNMPQIAMACALEYLDFRHDDRQWRDGRPNLAAFQASFGARPSMELTKPVE